MKMRYIFLLLLLLGGIVSNAQTKEEYAKRSSEYYETGEFNKALTQIDLALELDKDDTGFLFVKADILYHLKQFQGAFEIYSQIIKKDPKNVLALNQRGLLLRTIQEFEYSIKDFDRALSLDNIDSFRLSLLINRGASKVDIRDFDGAYKDFMAAYKLDSLNIGVLNNLAAVSDEIGKGDETLGYLFRILKIDSTFTGAYVNIGFKYQEMGEYKKAIDCFDKVITNDPNDALAYSNRSFNRMKLGNLTGAMSDVNKSIELYPANSFAFKNRALIYLEKKDYKNLCADLDKALELGFTKMYGKEVEELRLKHCLGKRL